MESGNDYVIQVKGNFPKISHFVKQYIQENDPADLHYTKEKNRGRIERREYKTYSVKLPLKDYPSIRTIIHTINSGIRKTKRYEEHHYYISNKSIDDAQYYSRGIRGHWSIENRLHWVKDAIMYEDKSRVKGLDLSANLSVLRNITMNIYRLNKFKSNYYTC